MKKLISLLLVAAMALTLLAGCGGSGDTTPDAPGTDGPISIEFWHSMSSGTGELIQKIVEDYNASQDKIHVECIYQGDYTTAGTKIQAAVSTGDTPAVCQLEIARIGTYAEAGVLLDMLPYIEADDEFNLDDMYEGLLDYSYYNDQLISMPNGRSVPVMYYNVDMMEEAGVEAPTNWDELRSAATALTKEGTYGYCCPIGDSWYYMALMLTAGGQIYNEEGNNIGFNDESGTKPLHLWLDMIEEGTMYVPEGQDYNSSSACRNAFMAKTAAMIMQSSAQYMNLVNNSEFEVGVCYIPKDVTYAAIPGGSNLVMFDSGTKAEQDAAWEFMKYMNSPEVATRYAAGTGYLPTSEAAYNSETYQNALKEYPFLGVAVGQLEYFVESPFDETYSEVKDVIVGGGVQECIINGASPEDVVAEMYEKAGALY